MMKVRHSMGFMIVLTGMMLSFVAFLYSLSIYGSHLHFTYRANGFYIMYLVEIMLSWIPIAIVS